MQQVRLCNRRPPPPLHAPLSLKPVCASQSSLDIVPISTADWAGVLGGGDFQFFLRRLEASLRAMQAAHGSVALLGHSAGGWVARILLGDVPYQGSRALT